MAEIIETQKVIRGEEIQIEVAVSAVEGAQKSEDDDNTKMYNLIGPEDECFNFDCMFYTTDEDLPFITTEKDKEQYWPIDDDNSIVEWDNVGENIYNKAMFTVPTIDFEPGRLWCKIIAYIPNMYFEGDEEDRGAYLNNYCTKIKRIKTNVIVVP